MPGNRRCLQQVSILSGTCRAQERSTRTLVRLGIRWAICTPARRCSPKNKSMRSPSDTCRGSYRTSDRCSRSASRSNSRAPSTPRRLRTMGGARAYTLSKQGPHQHRICYWTLERLEERASMRTALRYPCGRCRGRVTQAVSAHPSSPWIPRPMTRPRVRVTASINHRAIVWQSWRSSLASRSSALGCSHTLRRCERAEKLETQGRVSPHQRRTGPRRYERGPRKGAGHPGRRSLRLRVNRPSPLRWQRPRF